MKFRSLLYTMSIVLLLSSCAPTSFYQLYDVKPANESITKSDMLVFEDENCIITYNLWSLGGDIGFNFYNKSNSMIYVKLNESFFILNGFAYDYFKNRTFTKSDNKSISTMDKSTFSMTALRNNFSNIQTNQIASSSNFNSSVGYAISMEEDSIICIPPKTIKRISEYSINNSLIRDCDLLKYPMTNKQINTVSFTENESPIVFSNRITYTINGNLKEVTNEFYVSEITNYPASQFFENNYEEFCGQKSLTITKNMKYYDIDKFYIKYSKGTSNFKH
ncbi:MAG: hypothetical protein PHR53_00775 [Bacteroidales bacterium]|nr:hypothetical protein [Bacteroidales bacterium]